MNFGFFEWTSDARAVNFISLFQYSFFTPLVEYEAWLVLPLASVTRYVCGCSELASCSRSWMMPRQSAGHWLTLPRHRLMMNSAMSATQASPPTVRRHSGLSCLHHDHRHSSFHIDTAPHSFRHFLADECHHRIGSILRQPSMLIAVVTPLWESYHDLGTFRRQEEDHPNIIDLLHLLTAIVKSRT